MLSLSSSTLIFSCIGGSGTEPITRALLHRGYTRNLHPSSSVYHVQFSILSRLTSLSRESAASASPRSSAASASAPALPLPRPSCLPFAVHCHIPGTGPSLTSKLGLTRSLREQSRWVGVDGDEFYPRAFIVRKRAEQEGGWGQRSGRHRRAQLLLREGERELRLAYRRQCALCGVKRAVIAALLTAEQAIDRSERVAVEEVKEQQLPREDAEAAVAVALRALHLWVEEMRRAKDHGVDGLRAIAGDRPEEQKRQEEEKEEEEEEAGKGGDDAELSEAEWEQLVWRFECSGGQTPRGGRVDAGLAQAGGDESSNLHSPGTPDLFLTIPRGFTLTCQPSTCPFTRPPLLPSSTAQPWLRSALCVLHAASHLDPQFFLSGLRNLWICKPGGLSRGRGIEVHSSYAALRSHFTSTTSSSPSSKPHASTRSSPTASACSTPSNTSPSSPAEHATESDKPSSSFICQRYIESPLLVQGHKFDVRVWALLVNGTGEDGKSPTRSLWVYADELYARMASLAYDAQSASPFVHLTNHSIQHHHPAFSSLFPHHNQLSLADLSQRMSAEWPHLPPLASLLPHLHSIILAAVRAAEQSPPSASSSSASSPSSISYSLQTARYALLGFDFMLDSGGCWWLLECNSSPTLLGIGVDGLVQRMVEGMVDIVCSSMEQRVREERNKVQREQLGAVGDDRSGLSADRGGARDQVGGWKLLDCCPLQSAAGVNLAITGSTLSSSKAPRTAARR